ncbi:alkaline phosphatase family protein [Neptunitalea lumnitzerae]|uniref:Alkaline phosphatase family protein n=1 Tax=Neptunitalea lumnitzerae TaxID=2965509 RepID=A0ABQ5MJP2_9FLAO|nr:ectonucleotide pyrophosphatase/phosphodiesterase [Neptunitalea sp. Y10]GLB49633.1 alkaline phosphatase family protein [Neptunitalea sp. Y10]
MNKFFKVTCAVFLLSIFASATAQEVKHVVLISVDGFRSDFYKEEKWPTANMKMLAEKGVSAEHVRTIFPSVTYPSHTTLSTGVFPAEHGVYYNTYVGENGQPKGWIYNFDQVKAKTIWQYAKEQGLTTASVSWPVTVNNPYIDYNIPEIWSFEDGSDRRGATAEYANPKGLYDEVTKNVTGAMEKGAFNLSSYRMDENLGRMAAYILEKYKPNLLTIHLPNTDGAQHKSGRESEEVHRAISGADHAISNIYDALQRAGILDNTAIIITGDHGFVTTHTCISPNLWLKANNLFDKAFFFSTGGSAFLHLRNKKDKTTLAKVKRMLDELPYAQKQMFKIIDEQTMRIMKSDPTVDLAISAMEGYSFDNANEGNLLKSKTGGKHGYFPDFEHIYTGFIGSGAGFKKGVTIPMIHLEDITPIIAELLKLDIRNVDGIAPPGLFEK